MSDVVPNACGKRLDLPQVSLLAVTSVNLEATIDAIRASVKGIRFAKVKLLTSLDPGALESDIEHVPITPIRSSSEYSNFILKELKKHFSTSHCLVVQWDGYALRPGCWKPEFLQYDYIGARWPQFSDGYCVGNGGFSLRSAKLLEALQSERFEPSHPEDVAIGRHNRPMLEAHGLSFAPPDLADAFSPERTGDLSQSFGFHGV